MKSLFCFLLFISSGILTASPLPDFPFVTVTGESVAQVPPDTAEISIGLTVFDPKSEKASLQLTEVTQNMLAILRNYQIADSAISSYEIAKSTKRKRDERYTETAILGYELSRTFIVTLDSLKHYKQLVTELQRMDNIDRVNSTFDSSNREKTEVKLIAEAAEKAKQKAQLMAQGLGVELDGVFAFNDEGSFNTFFATFGLDSDGSFVQTRRRVAPPSESVFIPQSIKVSKTVNVIYKIKH